MPVERGPGRGKEESAIVADYGERYRARDLEAARRVETAALGTSCGANSYTTTTQADELVKPKWQLPDDEVIAA